MSDPAGQTIKGYEIRKKLGEGGFGAVYLAYQAAVDREVAIKAIKPSAANQPDFIRRFEFEARTVARLEHPYIVPLFDYWRDPEGAYLVMRFLRGGSLTDVLERGKPNHEQVVQIVEQIGSALQAAHRAGVIHRDLKPDNILMDEEGNAYLADFGIAKVVGAQDDDIGTSGTPAYMSPEQITSGELTPQTDMYAFGIILYEMMVGHHPFAGVTVSKLIFAHIEETLPEIYDADVPLAVNEVIQKATAKTAADRYTDMQALVKAFRRALGSMGAETLEIPEIDFTQLINPYKGLRAFQEEDQDDFFGRETLIDRLLARLAEDDPLAYFLAVIGPSGSGKSSVVKAGLLPSLRKGFIPGSDTWYISEMVPGNHPLNNLEDALLRLATFPPAGISNMLRTDKNGLTLATAEILKDTTDDVLLVIDQFEELFTLCEDEAERTHFMDLIYNTISDPNTRVHIIITLRADYIDRPLLYGEFGELMRVRMELVLPMSADELERAISAPAQRIGASVDANLIAQIASDVREEPGALPLLQYALTEVFERREGGYMTLGAYHDIGGVAGALAKRAEELFVELPADQGIAARQIFLRLVTLGEGAGDTRRRIKRSELSAIIKDPKVLDAVLDNKFGKARLLSFDRDAETREPTVEVAHEALIREWTRLHQWMDASRDDIRLQRLLAAANVEWTRAAKDPSFLLSGSRLAQYEEWVRHTDLALTPDERAYFDASVVERDKQDAAEKERQERERTLERESAANAQRAARGLRVIAAVLAVGVLVALGLSGVAFNQSQIASSNAGTATVAQGQAIFNASTSDANAVIAQQNEALAESAANEALSGRIALQGVLELNDGRIDNALMLSVGALSIDDTREAHSSLLTSLENVPQLDTMLYEHADEVYGVAYSPDGTMFASADQSGIIIVWDSETNTSIDVFSGHRGRIWDIAFSPDSSLIASVGNDGTLRLWNVNTHEPVGSPIGNLSDAIFSVAFTPDGRDVISGNSDGTIRVWDVATGEQIQQLQLPNGDERVYALAISDDGGLLASGDDYNNITLWRKNESGAFEQSSVLTGHTNVIYALDISPDGTTIASGSQDLTVRLWDIATGTQRGQALTDHTNAVWSVAFSPDGSVLATGSEDHLIILRNATTGQRLPDIAPLIGHSAKVLGLAFSPDGQHLISGGEDTRVLVWTVRARQPLSTIWTGHLGEVYTVAYTPDGTQVLSSSADARALLWDAATGQVVQEFPDPLGVGIDVAAISPDGTMYAFGMGDGRVRLLVNGQPGPTIAGHEISVRAIAFSSDGQELASADQSGRIILWDTATGAQIGDPLVGHEDVVDALAFSPDDHWLASGSFDHTVKMWDLTGGSPTATLQAHTDYVTAVAFSPDGTILASASRDHTVALWNVGTRELIGQRLAGHTDWVLGLAFSHDGRTLASGSRDRTIILWDVDSRQAIGQPLRGTGLTTNSWIWSVAFSPDDLHLIAGSRDTTLRLWDVSLASWQQRACAIANRWFTLTEWQRYFGDRQFTNACQNN